MNHALAVVIIAAMAWGRRVQGGFFANLGSRWERPIYAAIAGAGALLLTRNPVIAACVLVGWWGACHVGLFDSIGRGDAVWRGALRGVVQPLPAVLLILAAHFMGWAPASPTIALWPALCAFEGPLYKLGWLLDGMTQGKRWHVQATVFGEYATGALRGAGMVIAL